MSFLPFPEPDAAAQQIFKTDMAELGFVMNASRLWAYQPKTFEAMFDVMRQALAECGLSLRQRGILVAASVSTMGDSYCALAWGRKLAEVADAPTAAGVLRGDDAELTDADRTLAVWARKVAADPNAVGNADVQELRDAGYSDAQIFGITVYVAMRIALATVNDALGAQPDAEYREKAPEAVLKAVTFGRPIAAAKGRSPC
jgi:uncharacterized peroxidase-related enzyme